MDISLLLSKRFRRLLIVFIILFAFPVILHILPFPALTAFMEQEYSCRIYDRHNLLVQVTALEGGGRREFTPIKNIPGSIQKNFIQQEDKRFYFHHGIDWLSLSIAFIQNLKARKIVRGGSTISMQLAKQINKDKSHTIKRKIKDIIYAYRIEAKLSKKKILELYLNSIYFGANSYGITSAARTYFACELTQLDEGQIQVLSVIPRNPSFYNPIENKKRFEAFGPSAKQAVNKAGYFKYPYNMPHFVNYLSASAKKNNHKLPYELHISADLEITRMSQNFLREALEEARGSRITNGALLLIDNKDCSVISWLGNGDFFDKENSGQIDGVLVKNQPGSSMKPFLYALALDNNILSPSSVIADVPSEFGSEKLYIPENFNNRFNGPVRMRIALASSLNVPAVSTLNKIGVDSYLKKLYELGFYSLKENNAGLNADLGLALGAAEVSLYELVPAFSVFTRDGIFLPLQTTAFTQKQTVEKKLSVEQNQVYSTDTARLICSILSDKAARSLGFGYSQTFQTDYPSIFKTGTSNQYQDIVALGSTKNFTIGVWMGNFSGQTVMGKTGSSLPAWVAKNILDNLEGSDPFNSEKSFPEPENWHKERICSISGMKAGRNCRSVVTEYVKNNTIPDTCTWHTRLNNSDEISLIYPPEYQQWLRYKKSIGNKNLSLIEHSNFPLTVLTPNNNSLFFYSSQNSNNQAITFELIGGSTDSLSVFYDNKKIATINRPFIFSLPVNRGEHSCRCLCGKEEVSVNFTVK